MVTFPKDAEYLAKLKDYYAKWRSLPSYTKLGRVLGIASRSAVGKVLNRLREEEYLSRTPDDVWVPTSRFFERPLADFQVPAGSPTTATDSCTDAFLLDQYLIAAPSKTTLVQVRGDSMIEAGIFDGDMAVVEREKKAKKGDHVLAIVDGELTLKTLDRENDKYVLIPANKDYPIIRPKGTLELFGVVVGILRKYGK